MNDFPINKKSNNMEVFAKIANSLVRKYNCSVKYDHESGLLNLTGDENCKSIAIKELSDFLDNNG